MQVARIVVVLGFVGLAWLLGQTGHDALSVFVARVVLLLGALVGVVGICRDASRGCRARRKAGPRSKTSVRCVRSYGHPGECLWKQEVP